MLLPSCLLALGPLDDDDDDDDELDGRDDAWGNVHAPGRCGTMQSRPLRENNITEIIAVKKLAL